MQSPQHQKTRPLAALVALVVGLPVFAELGLRTGVIHKVPPPLRQGAANVLLGYLEIKDYLLARWWWLLPSVIIALLIVVLVVRAAILLWRNTVVARLSGAHLATETTTFPRRGFEVRRYITRTPAGKYFLGLDPKRKPVYLSEADLDTHGHIMGHTGSGKTRSVLEPLMFQDMARGKGVLFMDAKGSAENVRSMKALAAVTDRWRDLRVFSLAHPQWSQTYNPVYLGPASDPLAAAERVFSVFNMENEYYRGQAKLFFYSLIRLMHGTGKPFNLVDVRLAIADEKILNHVVTLSKDKGAVFEIDRQLHQLGKRKLETFTGLYNALADYDHPLLNSYNPDIVIEDLMQQRGIAYFNLPANRYPILAPAIGKIVLQHVKTVGALRQIERDTYDQTPFSVNIDELNRFAFPELVPSLAMLRDAHVQFRLAHQSLGDLEQVSPVFATQVKDNTRWKVFLFENDPDHLEKIARSYGTHTTFKKTVRFSLGPLFTFLNTGEVSNREVEEFVLHPNKLKSLAPMGQGYLLLPDRISGVNFETLPRFDVEDYSLPRRPAGEGLNLYARFVEGSDENKPVAELTTAPTKGKQHHAA